MLVRFVVEKKAGAARSRLGIIHAADDLLYEGRLEPHEVELLAESMKWFELNLPVPGGASSPGRKKAISWFRHSAAEAIDRMWSIVAILREHGLAVEVVRTSNPGRILHEDDQQVFAVPFSDRNASS